MSIIRKVLLLSFVISVVFTSKTFDRVAIKNMIENNKVFLIKDMGLDKFFVLR